MKRPRVLATIGVGVSAAALALAPIVGVALAAPAAAADTVVFSNDFEGASVAPWGPRGSIALATTTADAHTGLQALSVSGRTGNWNGPSTNIVTATEGRPAFVDGTTYTVDAWVKLAPGTVGTSGVHFTVEEKHADGTSTGYTWVGGPVDTTADGWVQIGGTYTKPAGLSEANLYIEAADIGDVHPDFLVDDVLVTTPDTGETGLSTDFESGLGAWGARGDGTNPQVGLSTTEFHGGAQAASVSGRTQAWHGLGATTTGIFVPGRVYNISAWVKLAAGTVDPANVRVSVQRTTEGTSSYDTVVTAEGVTADAWVKVEGQYTMAAAETSLLYVETSSGTPSFLVDDISVKGDTAPPVQTDIPSLQDTVPWPFGVAIDQRETVGAGEQLVTKHYDQITPENDMKPEEIQPTEGTFTFGDADALVDFAVANDLRVHGHTLVWHSQTPAWFFQHTDGTPLSGDSDADRALLLERMKTHIDTVADHFRDKYGEYGTAGNPITSFDVVNEAVDESQADGLRRSPWYNILGPSYIDDAFEFASEAFNGGDTENPAVELFINDYNTEQPAKRQATYELLQGLIERDVPVDGIGNQLHLSLSTAVSQIKATLDLFATLPLVQDVSELDVVIDGTVTANKLVQQGYYYKSLFDLLRQYPDLYAVTVWGPYDSRSWRSSGQPLPFDGDLQAKPAYWGIADPAQLPTLTQTALAHAGDPSGAADHTWTLLPDTAVGTGGSGFQVRWSADHLTARVHVEDATDDGAADTVTLFGAGGVTATVARGSAGSTEADGGYDVVATLPVAGLAQGGSTPFDVRIADGSAAEPTSWNDLSHHQEDGLRLGSLDLVEAVGHVTVPKVTTAPVIDGEVDAEWADAPTVSTDVLVEGAADGAKAQVKALWTDTALHLLFQVTDPTLDATSSNAWEQDSVETFLDPINAKNGSYLPDDGQYRVNFQNFQSISGDLTVIGDRLTSATKVVDGGYVVEQSIAFGRTASIGDLAGLDLQVNDGTAGVRTAVHAWTDPTGRSYQNTSRWGVAELVGPVAPPASAPKVTTQPQSVSGAPGSTVTLTAAASGQPAPTVQWQVQTRAWCRTVWKNVPGATSPTLSVKVDPKHSGATYRAVFTNPSGTVVTKSATVSVAKAKPVITTQPQSVAGVAGSTVRLTAAATGYPTPSVRWESLAPGQKRWTSVGWAYRTTLDVRVSAKTSGTQYRAVFSNRLGSATTQVATVTVKASAPKITSQPRSTTVRANTTATFKVGVSGSPEPKVQWYVQKKGSLSWTKVSGATSTTLHVKATTSVDGTKYRAVATSSAGTATSDTATLQVKRR